MGIDPEYIFENWKTSKVNYIYNKLAREEIEFFNVFAMLITGKPIINEEKKKEMSTKIRTQENDAVIKEAEHQLRALGII